MIAYKNSQMGYLLIGVLVLGFIVTLTSISVEAISLLQYMLLMAFILALVLFYKLNVEVQHGVIICSFGQGAITKIIRVAELAGCRVIKVPWYYGWGIRLTPQGWMYNISGTQAVEISYKSGKKFIIGSNEAESLCEAIEEEMKKYP